MTIPMEILLNGAPRHCETHITIAALLEAEGLGQRRVAVEVDGQIIPRSQHLAHVLEEGCKVEIVHALGGG